MTTFEKIKNRILIVIIISVVFYFAFLVYSNASDVMHSFAVFHWWIFPVMLLFAFTNYIIRGIKWTYYLSVLKIRLSRKQSFIIFFSGLSMSITPAKLGEVVKSLLLKKDTGTGIMTGVSIVFVERITDLLGMLGLLCVGLLTFVIDLKLVIIVFAVLLAIIILIHNKRLVLRILKYFRKKKRTRKMAKSLRESYLSAYELLQAKPLFVGFWLSFFSWSFECMCLYLALTGLGIPFGFFDAIFIFAFCSIIGVVSMLPGGLGSTEGAMTLLLVTTGSAAISLSTATAAVILVRLATLWFAVILGIVALTIWQRKDRKNDAEKEKAAAEGKGKNEEN